MSDRDELDFELPTTEEIQRAMYENVAKGHARIIGERDGEPIFAMTEEGERHVRENLLDDAEGE